MGRATKEEYPQIAGAVLYTLADPCSPSEIRYVGITRRKPEQRGREHLYGRFADHAHKCRWIRSLSRRDLIPLLRVAAILEERELDATEVRYIAALRIVGARLTNTADGGKGAPVSVQERLTRKRKKINRWLARRRTADLKLEQKTRDYFAAVQAGTWVGPEPRELCFPLPPMSRDEIAAWNAKNTEALKSWPKEKVKRWVA
jgi:hypothetical protein